jgi:DNA-binding transcriptional MerR regulator
MNDPLTISQVARRAGMQASAVRYYERIGLLLPPRRVSGQRRYEPAVVERLLAIRHAASLGFALAEIHLLLDGFPADTPASSRWRSMAQAKLPQIDAAITRLTAMKRLLESGSECACPRIEDCLGVAIRGSCP